MKIPAKIIKICTMTKKHDIIWLESIDSTNDEARRRIDTLDNLSVLSALHQTSGRGQRGNTWSSTAGENLTFSIVLKYGTGHADSHKEGKLPAVRAIDQFIISEIAALSVVDCLSSHGISAQIKWPNDIYVGNKKLCGILIEHSVRENLLSSSIIGIGLNVNQRNFDVNLPNPTSMVLCRPESFDLPSLLEEFMEIFSGYCTRFINITGGYSRLRKLYLGRMWRMEEDAGFIDLRSTEEFTGRIKGLSDIGHLLIEDTKKGELKEFAFKEIGYIL